jgi:hypothetical protein
MVMLRSGSDLSRLILHRLSIASDMAPAR